MNAQTLRYIEPGFVEFNNRKLIFFGGYDYLNLSFHPLVRKTFTDTLKKEGMNTLGSRATTGNHQLFEELEQKLSEFTGLEASVLISSGYLSNLLIFKHLISESMPVLVENDSHSSLWEGLTPYIENIFPFYLDDLVDLHETLTVDDIFKDSKALMCCEGLKSLTGQTLNIAEMIGILDPNLHHIFIDESHSLGVLGPVGKGLSGYFDRKGFQVTMTASLSKVLGGSGGMISGNSKLIDSIKNSDVYRGSSTIPLPQCAAIIKSIDLILNNHEWQDILRKKSYKIKSELNAGGLEIPINETPVFFLDSSQINSNALREKLLKENIYPPFIKYPGGPNNGFFRFAVSLCHSEDKINTLIKTIISCRKI